MKVTRVDITDFRIITSLTIHARALNAILGDNGIGKTSVLKAIASVFEGGHSPNFIRTGAKRAQVKLTLDNGTTIVRTITPKTSTLEIKTADGAEIPKPETFVKTLASGFSFDPLAFISAKPKERLAYLQRALAISFEPEEVAVITGPVGIKPAAPLDLDGINNIRKAVYDLRTQQNTLAKQADGTVERLTGTIAEDQATDWDAEVKRIQDERDAILDKRRVDEQSIAAQAGEERANVRAGFDQRIYELRKQIEELNGECTKQLGAIDVAEREAVEEAHKNTQEDLDQLNLALGNAQANAKRKAQNEVVKREIETARAARDGHKEQAESMTAMLSSLDKLKQQKLDTLPIEDVEVRDGTFYVGGVAFDDLNEGAKFLKAFEVGSLLPNPLGLMIADGAETLSTQSFSLFRDAAIQSGFQVFCSRVTDGELVIETAGELETVAAQ